MADLDAVLEQLKRERQRAESELRQLEKAIATLSKAPAITSPGLGKRAKRRLSSAARERIAAAQRARWAKARAQSGRDS